MTDLAADLTALTDAHGPLEVALIVAPEEYLADAGHRRISGAYRLQLGVAGTARDSAGLSDLSLILTDQTATALHSFLSALLDPKSRPRRGLPMLPPEIGRS